MKTFLEVPIKVFSKHELFALDNYPIHLVTLNAQYFVSVQKNNHLSEIVKNSYTCVDGQVPLNLINLIFPKLKIQKISGSDLIYDFCVYASDKKLKLFLLGGNEDSNEESVRILTDKYKVPIKGYSNPMESYPFSKDTNEIIKDKIRDFMPDILFVGYGLPKQDYWINDNMSFLSEVGLKFIIGSGGTFEFVSNRIKRAPKIIQILGLEMIFRFIVQPNKNRLNRIFESFPIFIYFIKKYILKKLK